MNKRVRQKTFSRISWELKEINLLSTDKGNLAFRIDSSGSIPHGQNSIRGEPETFEWISHFLKPGEIFLDIGANIGVFSLYAAMIKNTKVISLEPSAETFSTLNANIRLNNLDKQIEAYCLAASNKTHLSKLFMKDSSSGASHNSLEKAENQFGPFQVDGEQAIMTIRIDDLINFFGCPIPSHIKLDIDGRELEVLEGSLKILETIKSLLVEIEGKNLSKNFEKINVLLEKAGLIENEEWRNKGSGRNRLFIRNKKRSNKK